MKKSLKPFPEDSDLSSMIEKVGYDALAEHHPALILSIKNALGLGGTAEEIDTILSNRFDRDKVTTQLAIGAAYYLEKQLTE